jgi:hypothetical protein
VSEAPTGYVATVCSYWPLRRANVERIVRDLAASTLPPSEIIVVNNGDLDFTELADADLGVPVAVMTPGFNTWTRGKFIAALLTPAPYYLMIDEDTSVGPRTAEVLMSWAGGRRGMVTGYWGVKLAGRSFMSGGIIQPHLLPYETKVDAFHGRAMFMAYDAVVRMLAVEEDIRIRPAKGRPAWHHEGDDIIAGLANPEGSYAIALKGDAAFVDLDQCGQALQFQDGYFAERDSLTGDILDALAAHPAPQW